ncbi:hypothetical protein HBE96_14585 [Clostridium sp. P21]|uniref:Uncharacterized protein n=1 Tax=Clostridium muellerianum TaxID=2716538 RepID=A0A7Y0EI37_9CLOT|nr:hypothetical protein [Clostridium muellerianum]NMM63881.1 hypothetical protein [Clostridium muellerianum]
MDNLVSPSPLDEIRIKNGIDNLNTFFHSLFKNNSEKSINLINHEDLNFASLFTLKNKIQELNIFHSLNPRNKLAIEIINEIYTGKKNSRNTNYLSCDYVEGIHAVLKWILVTGSVDDGMNNEYDEILDISAALLTKVYRDKTVLSVIADMIFKRYKKGFLIHNLVWAFFECRDPKSLIIIAQGLQSKELKDIELSKKLLNFVPGVTMIENMDKNSCYLYFLNWLEKNFLFLHFTGESFQKSSNPIPYIVILRAKYICAPVSIDSGKILTPLKKEEINLLKLFDKLDNNTKLLLSNFSFNFHRKNIYNWNKWLYSPMAEQIKIARLGGI